jgi:hypothetical protein
MPKFLDQVCESIGLKHYFYRTEESCVQWITRYILYHDKRHPNTMKGKHHAIWLRAA